jgi:hypothetical protein
VRSHGERPLLAIQRVGGYGQLVTLHADIERGLGSAHRSTFSLQIPLAIYRLIRSRRARLSCAKVGLGVFQPRPRTDRLVRRPFARSEFKKRRSNWVFVLTSAIPQVDRCRHHHGKVADDERYTILGQRQWYFSEHEQNVYLDDGRDDDLCSTVYEDI